MATDGKPELTIAQQRARVSAGWRGGVTTAANGRPFGIYVTNEMREEIRAACAARGGISAAEFTRESLALALWAATAKLDDEIELPDGRRVKILPPAVR